MSHTRLSLQVRLYRDDEIALGPGKADLLEAIAKTGSISGAAREMGMSYRRAWLLVDTMNRCFRSSLVETAAGGSQGGGTHLTPLGEEVLARYRALEVELAEVGARHEAAIRKLLLRG
jgi:molybdate transport system regulatory protein